jgi:hypothetical protein
VKPPIIPPPPIIQPPRLTSPKPPTITLKLPTITLKPSTITPTRPTSSPTPREDENKEPAVVESVPALLASDEDVGWMALPEQFDKPVDDEPSSARPSLLPEALPRTLSRARSACEALVTHWIKSLARRDWQATRLWLTSQVASAYALLAPWKSLVRGDRPLPSFSPGEAAPWRAVDSERTAPLEPRPAVGVPVGARVLEEEGTDSPGVYRPRRSTEDGLPILQLEPLSDEEGTDSLGGYGSRRSAEDDLPILQLEPLDDEEGRDSFGGSSSRRPTDDAPEIILEPLDDEVATNPRRRNSPARLRAKS